jgi:hypothetical protein
MVRISNLHSCVAATATVRFGFGVLSFWEYAMSHFDNGRFSGRIRIRDTASLTHFSNSTALATGTSQGQQHHQTLLVVSEGIVPHVVNKLCDNHGRYEGGTITDLIQWVLDNQKRAPK